jgi:hypothetical protein
MPAFPRSLLLLSHATALAIGCWFARPQVATPVTPVVSAQETKDIRPATPVGGDRPASVASAPGGAREFAAAWELLRREKITRGERRALQEALLEKWSVVDLEAALRASLAEFQETRGDIPGLVFHEVIVGCDPGIRARPEIALQLIRDKTLGFGSARLRDQWLRVLRDERPELLFAALGEFAGDDRTRTLEELASSLRPSHPGAAVDPLKLAKILPLHDRPGGTHDLRQVASQLADSLPLSALQREMNAATDPARRTLFLSAFAQSLAGNHISAPDDPFDSEKDPFADLADSLVEADDPLAGKSSRDVWKSLPAELRSEVAAEGLHADTWDGDMTFTFARQALADGNLDALKAAAEHDGFGRYADNTEQPAKLADWALTLPEDPRTRELYRISIGGAAVRDFPSVREKILALPPGWQRDQGIAALAYGGHHSGQAIGEIERLLERIQDPDVKVRAKQDYREQREADAR